MWWAGHHTLWQITQTDRSSNLFHHNSLVQLQLDFYFPKTIDNFSNISYYTSLLLTTENHYQRFSSKFSWNWTRPVFTVVIITGGGVLGDLSRWRVPALLSGVTLSARHRTRRGVILSSGAWSRRQIKSHDFRYTVYRLSVCPCLQNTSYLPVFQDYKWTN